MEIPSFQKKFFENFLFSLTNEFFNRKTNAKHIKLMGGIAEVHEGNIKQNIKQINPHF